MVRKHHFICHCRLDQLIPLFCPQAIFTRFLSKNFPRLRQLLTILDKPTLSKSLLNDRCTSMLDTSHLAMELEAPFPWILISFNPPGLSPILPSHSVPCFVDSRLAPHRYLLLPPCRPPLLFYVLSSACAPQDCIQYRESTVLDPC